MRRASWFVFYLFLLSLFTPPALTAASGTSAEDPKKVEGTPYDGNAIMVLPGSPQVTAARGTAAPGQAFPSVQTYSQLIDAVRGARIASRARVRQSVERELVREAWEIGQLIEAHVLQHKERADYGKKVLLKLANDLGMSETELRYMLQFARAYPIAPSTGQLSWSDYRELLSLNDSKEREAVAGQAVQNKWNQKEIREEVKKRKTAKNGTPVIEKEATLTAQPGKPGTYKIVKATAGPEAGKVVIDLGFSNYYKTSKDLSFKAGAIIEATPPFGGGGSAPSGLIKLSRRTPEDLYTYRAWVVRVLDGDTIEAVVDLGFGVRSVQTLRLRGIDCPELVSKEGEEAKAFVEKALQVSGNGERGESKGPGSTAAGGVPVPVSILIKTTKSDKYDRYLADIFVPQKDGSNLYLNNELLEKRLAVKVQS